MNRDEDKKWLEALGYKVYDHAGDAVGMNEDEKELMDIRILLSRAVRNRRAKLRWTRKKLADQLGISPAKIAKIEDGKRDVSAEQIFMAYAAMDAEIADDAESSNARQFRDVGARNGTKPGVKPRKKKTKVTA
jgi:DNA-binding XRE family transcriptional regulator